MNIQQFSLVLWSALLCQGISIVAQEKAINPVPVGDAHQAWKLATEKATTADMITVPDGFAVDLVRSAGEDEGSWITLEFDDKNHLYVSKEDKGILRFTLDSNGHLINKEVINEDLEQCRGLLWAHNSLYVNCNNMLPPNEYKVSPTADGIFRLKDTDNDGTFDSRVKLLETSQGMPGHGRNQMKLGPDGLIYFMSGYDVFLTDKVDDRSFLRNFGEDNLIPNPWDEEWFNKHGKPPGGHLIRMDEEGKFFQLIAGGFRNPMDLAFNKDGEIFTYDADMEWDAALAWYRPTRILHLVSGGDYGWRRGVGKWPTYYEDSLPPAVDVGLGSPTGIEFGYQSNFPEKWQNMLFAGDWTYGRIIAVDLTEKGSSFGGSFQTFAAGRPMNVVDLTFGPDGNLYFVTGGMKTKTGIYRVRWVGDDDSSSSTAAPPAQTSTEDSREAILRNLRYQLEFFQVIQAEKGAQLALHYINHPDRFVRHAARIALENQDPALWVNQALATEAPAAFIALARGESLLPSGELVRRMNQIDLERYSESELLSFLRAYQVEFIRNGKPSGRNLTQAIANLSALFPHKSIRVNHELAELLVFLEAPNALPELCQLIENAQTTEDLSQYLVYARYIKDGWGLESKRTYLKGVQRLESFPGGKFHGKVVKLLRDEMVKTLSKPEEQALAKWVAPYEPPPPPPLPPVEFIKAWTVEDFEPHFPGPLKGRGFESGKLAYSKANCVLCHQMGSIQPLGKENQGPDLTNVGGRFGLKDLLVSIIDPSRAINDKYRNLAAPNFSPMPPGQINVLTEDEVLDLLAYLQAGGRSDDQVFQKVKPMLMDENSRPNVKKEEKPPAMTQTEAAKDAPASPEPNDLMQPQDKLDNPGLNIEPTLFKKMSAANLEDRERLYRDMKRILETYPNATFELVGHADDSQYEGTNLDISKNRAKFTALNMIYRGIPKEAISYSAVGDKEPSPKGNRRVEVKVKLGTAN